MNRNIEKKIIYISTHQVIEIIKQRDSDFSKLSNSHMGWDENQQSNVFDHIQDLIE